MLKKKLKKNNALKYRLFFVKLILIIDENLIIISVVKNIQNYVKSLKKFDERQLWKLR